MDGDLTIVFEPCEEGGYTAYIPEVPGAVSEGDTVEEAREMVLDALRELTAFRRREALKAKSGGRWLNRTASPPRARDAARRQGRHRFVGPCSA